MRASNILYTVQYLLVIISFQIFVDVSTNFAHHYSRYSHHYFRNIWFRCQFSITKVFINASNSLSPYISSNTNRINAYNIEKTICFKCLLINTD